MSALYLRSVCLVTMLQKFSNYFGDKKGWDGCATMRNCATNDTPQPNEPQMSGGEGVGKDAVVSKLIQKGFGKIKKNAYLCRGNVCAFFAPYKGNVDMTSPGTYGVGAYDV